jgi:uncharacterized protein (TIGR04255 family)
MIANLHVDNQAKDAATNEVGTLVDIDVWNSNLSDSFMSSPSDELNSAHLLLKNVFFSIIGEELLGSLQPEF